MMLHEGNCLLTWKLLSFLHTLIIYRYVLSHHSTCGVDIGGDEDDSVVVFLYCRILVFSGKNMPASVSAPQWEFNSLVGFESVSKGKNRQTPAATQIQKLWEIQGRVDLRCCPGSIPKLKQSIQRHCHCFSLETLLLCRPKVYVHGSGALTGVVLSVVVFSTPGVQCRQ